jgi:hypothetical protein
VAISVKVNARGAGYANLRDQSMRVAPAATSVTASKADSRSDGAGGRQRVDVGVCVSQLAQDLVPVLAEQGGRRDRLAHRSAPLWTRFYVLVTSI